MCKTFTGKFYYFSGHEILSVTSSLLRRDASPPGLINITSGLTAPSSRKVQLPIANHYLRKLSDLRHVSDKESVSLESRTPIATLQGRARQIRLFVKFWSQNTPKAVLRTVRAMQGRLLKNGLTLPDCAWSFTTNGQPIVASNIWSTPSRAWYACPFIATQRNDQCHIRDWSRVRRSKNTFVILCKGERLTLL